MFKGLFKLLLLLVVPGNPTFPSDVLDKLDEIPVRYEIVEEIKQNPRAAAYYDYNEDIIYFDKDELGNSAYRLAYLASHELIHKERARVFLAKDSSTEALKMRNLRIEEAYAVYGAEKRALALGFDIEINEKKQFKAECKTNGIKYTPLTKEELRLINEYLQTLQ